jgi:hypothetical protein
MNKKSQIKMTETIGVLVVFFILVLFGMIFYSQYQKSAIKQQQQAAVVKRTVAISLKAYYLPELRCTKGFDVVIPACIDLYKAKIFEQHTRENHDFYSVVFGKSDIYVKDIENNSVISLYNNTPAEWVKRIKIRFPVSIYDTTALGSGGEVLGTFVFGALNVDVYE